MRIDELRQYRQHEDQRLGVADVDQKATEHQPQRLADRPHGRLVADVSRQGAPLFDGQVDQIGNAEPFDHLKRGSRGGEDGANAGSNDRNLQHQPQLQAQGVPVAAPEAVLQTTGHRGNRPGAR
ncbi:hypothetical protein D3C81_886220 [compost metagenome]